MSAGSVQEPVHEEDVPRIHDDLNVGEDLNFQRKWWRFENGVWLVFGFLLVCNVIGLFGRGPIAKADAKSGDGTLDVRFERIQRLNTPSIVDIRFQPATVNEGYVGIFVSASFIEDLGAMRLSPQPEASIIRPDGIVYRFPANSGTGKIHIALSPPHAGLSHFRVQRVGFKPIDASIFVFP